MDKERNVDSPLDLSPPIDRGHAVTGGQQTAAIEDSRSCVAPLGDPNDVDATPLGDAHDSAPPLVRALAFHLPQFHAVPENDEWWGKGFTEWDNVRQGQPLFDGHYQPHEPGELGYYDLSDIDVLRKQAMLARQSGLAGFCFYYYWFDGRRLLEKPVDQLLAHPEVDLPFCLCWANENWTRRWDGGAHEVLLQQNYSESLGARFAEDAAKYFSDPRYIRVNGKPLFLVYRTDIIPNLPNAIRRWQATWRDLGLGEAYLVCVDSFTVCIPEAMGFDASCEFFPHQVELEKIAPSIWPTHLLDQQAHIGDYDKLADTVEARPSPPYKRFRCVVPSWDNAARRRKGGASLLVNATPERYEQWLSKAVQHTVADFDGDERLIFINAWNEWGEGCHLEPDLRHGRAYLDATRRAIGSGASLDVTYLRHVLPYQTWLSNRQRGEQCGKALALALADRLHFTMVIDATAATAEALAVTLRNVVDQPYVNLRLIVVSPMPNPLSEGGLVQWLQADEFPEALLSALAGSAPRDWFGILGAGDRIADGGFLSILSYLNEHEDVGLLFGDEDMLDAQYGPCMPVFKPDFDIDLLCSLPYMGRFLLWRGREYAELGGGLGDKGGLDYALRFFERFGAKAIGHVGEVLFHGAATSDRFSAKEHRVQVLSRHFERIGVAADIIDGLLPGSFRILYRHETKPLVSIVIPTRNQMQLLSRCIESLVDKTAYKNFEVLIVDNQSVDEDAKLYLQGISNLNTPQFRVLSYPRPFNFSAMNNLAVSACRGEYILLLNNDTAMIQPDWLDAMLNHALRPEVGIVGAKLLFPDGGVQHAGVVLGLRGPADHHFLGSAANAPGYMGRLLVDQQYSAVTAACLLMRKSVYAQVGGLDEGDFSVSYNDVDLCLKVREAGYSVVWTPYALVMHVGNATQRLVDNVASEAKHKRFAEEQRAMYRKWMHWLKRDPAYNENLSLSGVGFEIEQDTLCAPSDRGRAKIVAHHADETGCGVYRVMAPLAAMVDAGLATGRCATTYVDPVPLARIAPTSIIVQRQINDAQLAGLKDYRDFSGADLIYELDDYLPNLPLASVHKSDMPRDVLRRVRAAMSLCHRVVVSTEALKNALAGMHADIQVLPNFLPPAMWNGSSRHREPARHRRPRVGWAGGIGHSGDLHLIVDVVKALADRVDWVFCGMIPPALRNVVAEFHPGVPLASYPEKLASLELDLAIAPLDGGLFNECKSNLRLLEYGICGFPVIASDCVAYRGGLPVTLVKNRFKDWVAAIEEKLAEREALRQEGLALQVAVRRDWMLEGENLRRWYDGWMRHAV